MGALALTSTTSTIACAMLLAAVPSSTTTSMMRVSVEGVVTGAEPDLLQHRLILGERSGAREREDPGDGIIEE